MKKIFLGLVCFLLVFSINSKSLNKNIQPHFFDSNGQYFLTKFFMDEGIGSVSFKYSKHFFPMLNKTTINETENENDNVAEGFLSLIAVKAENWKYFQQEEQCQILKEKYSAYIEEFAINGTGETFQRNFTLKQLEPQLYYFIITDCHRTWIGNSNVKSFQYTVMSIEIRNTDDSHFSLEDQQMIFPCVLTMIAILGFIVLNLKHTIALYKQQEMIDYPLLLIGVTLFFEFLALGVQLMNQLYYQNYGINHFLLGFLQIFCETATNFLFTMIFKFVAWGWSINFMDISTFDFFVPSLAVIGAANLILVILNKIIYENDEKPMTDGLSWLNYVYLLYKFAFFLYFLKGIQKTYGLARFKIRGFVVKFIVLGILFFVSYGILLLISDLLSLHLKKKVLLIGNEMINMVVTLSLMKIFNSKIYNELSFKGKNVLPQEDTDIPKYI